MKICDATQFYSEVGGGVRRYLQEKRRYVLEHTEDEHILLVPGDRTGVVRDGRLTTCSVRSPRINRSSRYRILFNLARAEEFIHREKPDLIESGDPYHLGWRMIDAAHGNNIPVVGFYHSHFPEAYLRTAFKYCGPWVREVGLAYAQDYIVRLYNDFDVTLVPSEHLARLLAGWGVATTRPVRLGVDIAVFRPGPRDPAVRERLGLPADRILLLYVGRLAGEKNTPLLMEAFDRLESAHPGRYTYLVIGDGAQRPKVRELQDRIPHFQWMSYCHDSGELADIYRAADLFVHPGVCETFGLVTLESQACGCPVVGIHGTYMDALIAAGLEDWADANTPEALALAIDRYSRTDLAARGQAASEHVRARYSWKTVFDDVWKIYRAAIEQNRERRRHGALHADFHIPIA
ncbi:MAG: glycosyltransferase [Candidatus Methylacidiphilales bacterium]|nr:glycosyltransferase [Candidatus Methylacidiphilales bacterium]